MRPTTSVPTASVEFIAVPKIVSSAVYNKPSILMTFKSAMDISADLHELTRCSVGVVSAGVKSILDIGRYVMVPLI